MKGSELISNLHNDRKWMIILFLVKCKETKILRYWINDRTYTQIKIKWRFTNRWLNTETEPMDRLYLMASKIQHPEKERKLIWSAMRIS